MKKASFFVESRHWPRLLVCLRSKRRMPIKITTDRTCSTTSSILTLLCFQEPLASGIPSGSGGLICIPVANHRFTTTETARSANREWSGYLGGKFCGNTDPKCGQYTNVQRSCTVPRGKYLYFPIDNGEDSALEENVRRASGRHQLSADRVICASWRTPGHPAPTDTRSWTALWFAPPEVCGSVHGLWLYDSG